MAYFFVLSLFWTFRDFLLHVLFPCMMDSLYLILNGSPVSLVTASIAGSSLLPRTLSSRGRRPTLGYKPRYYRLNVHTSLLKKSILFNTKKRHCISCNMHKSLDHTQGNQMYTSINELSLFNLQVKMVNK